METIKDNLTVKGDQYIEKNLQINGNQYIHGNLEIGGGITGKKLEIIHGDITNRNNEKTQAMLHLRGADSYHNSYITNRDNFVGNGSKGNQNLIISSAQNIHLQTGDRDTNHGKDNLVIHHNGNIGIGTTTPNTKLDVALGDVKISLGHLNKKGALHFRGGDGNNNSYITNRNGFVGNGSQGNQHLIISSAQNIYLQTGDADTNHGHNRLVIHRNGNIGIGEASPKTTLHVKGSTTIEGAFKIISKTPFIELRRYSQIGNNVDYNTKMKTSEYIALVGGFRLIRVDLEQDFTQNFASIFMVDKGGYWHIRAQLAADRLQDKISWSTNVLFIKSDIATKIVAKGGGWTGM